MDDSDSKLGVWLGDCKISQWEVDGEDNDKEKSTHCSEDNENPPIRKLFVANLSGRTSGWDLRRVFCQYGRVIDAHVSRKTSTHKKRCFGFVTYKFPEDALSVLNLQHGELEIHKRKLYVAAADCWHQPIELPNGSIMLNPLSYARSRPLRYYPEVDNPEAQIFNEALLPSVSTEGNGETEAVGSSDLLSHTSSCNRVEQQQEGETENDGDESEEEGIECMIDILNNDCLMHIFSFLNQTERIGIERVCKRWQAVGLNMWLCQKHLDFASLLTVKTGIMLNDSILVTFLKRCGANLRSLDISQSVHQLRDSVLQTIAHHCQNLQCLNVAGVPVKSSDLRKLSTVCQNLRVLNLDGCAAIDKDLWSMFQNTPHLESLTLSHNSVLKGKCLTGLARVPLKKLVLDVCNNLRSPTLVKGLLVLKSLISLSVNSCMNLTSSDVAKIVVAVPRLQSLSMQEYFPLFNSATLKVLDQLRDLISLNVQHNPAINDQIMDVIARNCHKLEELNITGCNSDSWDQVSVTDSGVIYLAALPNLIHLSMSYLASVSDNALKAIASSGKLQKLVCRGCPSFTDVGCVSVVTSCNELELFDFSGCDLVSDATVQAALDSVKFRTKDIKLKLVVGGTCVSNCRTLEENSLLEIDWSDLCVTHLRPDFVDDFFSSSGDEFDDYAADYDPFDWECPSPYFDDLVCCEFTEDGEPYGHFEWTDNLD